MPANPNIQKRPAGFASTSITNELAAAVNALAPAMRSGPMGSGVSVETLFAKIAAPVDGSTFRYDAYLFGFDPLTQTAAGALTEGMLGTLSGWLACEVWNFAELGSASPLETDAIIPVRQLGFRFDDQKMIAAAMVSGSAPGRYLAIITSITSLGIGWYKFKFVARTVTEFDETADLDEADYNAAFGDEFLARNRAESKMGGATVRKLSVGQFVEVSLDGRKLDGTPIYRMYEFSAGC